MDDADLVDDTKIKMDEDTQIRHLALIHRVNGIIYIITGLIVISIIYFIPNVESGDGVFFMWLGRIILFLTGIFFIAENIPRLLFSKSASIKEYIYLKSNQDTD